MSNFLPKIYKLIMFAGDGVLLVFSLYAALLFRHGNGFNQTIWQNNYPYFIWLFIIWLIIFYAFNLYDLAKKSNVEILGNYLRAIAVNVVIGIFYFYLISPTADIKPKTILLFLVLVYSILFFIWRKFCDRIFSFKKLYQNLLFIGYAPLINELLPKQETAGRFGYNFKGIVMEPTADKVDLPLIKYLPEQLNEVIKKEKINLLVINEPDNSALTNLLFKALTLRVNFIGLTNFYEQATLRVPLKMISQGWFLENFAEGNKIFFEVSKRAIDLLFAVIIGLLSLPLMPLVVLLIALDSKGKIFFNQNRVGKDGKIFMAHKFRTMYQNAEKSGPQWASENDPRITKIGRLLRKTRIDEIPQLINVIKGDMSIVGPRPERPEFIEQLKEQIPFYNERLLVKPGLTGWAQINFPYASSIEDSLKKLQYDLFYIKHRSIFLDLTIFLKTISIMIKGNGR